MGAALLDLNLAPNGNKTFPGLVSVRDRKKTLKRVDEEAALQEAEAAGEGRIDYVFFRRFADGRSSQVSAYVVDNSDERFSKPELADLHRKLWLNGSAPLLYVGWLTSVDVLSCARGADFWQNGKYQYHPADTIGQTLPRAKFSAHVAATEEISQMLQLKRDRYAAGPLSTGTFWDNPDNAHLANAERAAHRRLIRAVVDCDLELQGGRYPLRRRLLLLTVLVKYLEDRGVFDSEPGWFGRFYKGAKGFVDVLQSENPEAVTRLLDALEAKFNGDIFSLGRQDASRLTGRELQTISKLIEARTLGNERYLWEQFSFRYIPVEVLSHLYQRFAQPGKGAVFTPPFLASLMLDFAMPYATLRGDERVLDPTAGSGVFLVGAFRRLVRHWRSQNRWRQPGVKVLKAILHRSIFGVELQDEAVHLSAFNLALAICDALQPDVIWRELHFAPLAAPAESSVEKTAKANLRSGDFFSQLNEVRALTGSAGFDIIVGNPPFLSNFTPAATQLNSSRIGGRIPVPDKQMAYLVAEQAMTLLKPGGRMCLIQPHGFLYNEGPRTLQKDFIQRHQLDVVLDFVSLRNLYDGADPKSVALLITRRQPDRSHVIQHFTFRRTVSVQEHLGFELDHYDYHRIPQRMAEESPWVWKANLLGGGRLVTMVERFSRMRKLRAFVEGKGWEYGEGFIAAKGGLRNRAPWLTGKSLLPTAALTTRGIDENKIVTVRDRLFRSAYTAKRYTAPLFLLKANDALPCAFRERGFLAYRDKIVGIAAPTRQSAQLRRFYETFRKNRLTLRALCWLLSTQAGLGRATAFLKRDFDELPWPENEASWRLLRWEQVLLTDVASSMAVFMRRGEKSPLLRRRAEVDTLAKYAELFVDMLGAVYPNLKAGPAVWGEGLAAQAFHFGDGPVLSFPADWTVTLKHVIRSRQGDALRTVRILRFYEGNVVLLIKPDRLRYWIPSTAIRDADETLADLVVQGF